MSKRERRRRRAAPPPATSAGLLRFFEEESFGIKIRPKILIALIITFIIACILINFLI
ncbi:MAG: preprotein translocase subunit Sec61beta [Candidatus Bathyarchaeia archaeon]